MSEQLICDDCPQRFLRALLEDTTDSKEPIIVMGRELLESMLGNSSCKGPAYDDTPYADCTKSGVYQAEDVLRSVISFSNTISKRMVGTDG
jgi:hypothetical protein